MSNWLIKYEPLCIVTTYSKKKYYIKKNNREKLEQMMEKNKFVKFWTSTVNVSSIDTIEEATNEDNFYQSVLNKYTYEDQNTIKKEVKVRKETNSKDLTPQVLEQIIKKYL